MSFITFLLSLSHAQNPPPIVNGSSTEEYEAVAAFVQCWGDQGCASFCSGTLVAQRWVVTAAHCVSELYGSGDYYFVFGPSIWQSEGFAEVLSWEEHADYPGMNSGYIVSDIAVVEIGDILDSNTGQSMDVMPIALNTQTVDESWYGEELQMVGYGITGSNRNDSGVKRTADMQIAQLDDEFIYLSDYQERQNVCSGDSGGAALHWNGTVWTLAGVNSFTYGECENWIAGVARVDEYLDWIEDRIEYLGEPIIQPLEPYDNKKPPAAACNATSNENKSTFWAVFIVLLGVLKRRSF
ncbi:MAG: hypothetical protein CMK59_15325 [Proteobacteria bacterium]|nr:hypothetical protein [Pseudomonadota bacterium]